MIFKTLNVKVEKKSYDFEISNVRTAGGHWGNEKDIESFLSEIENFLYKSATDKQNFEKQLLLHSAKIMKSSFRIKDGNFYNLGDNSIILLVVTDVPEFDDVAGFERQLKISFKNFNFNFSIVELSNEKNEDLKSSKLSLPIGWVKNEKLSNKLNKFKDFI